MDTTALTDQKVVAPAEQVRDGSGPRRWHFLAWTPVVALPAACLLWASGLSNVDLRAMNDYGLASVLPARIWAALILVLISFAVCWWRGRRLSLQLPVHIVVFIVLFYGIPPMVSEAARGPIAYRHLGVVEYLTRDRVIATELDVYFNWPGFFMGLGSLIEIGRLGQVAVTLARWSSVAINLFYFPALVVLLRTFTRNARLVWAAALFFFVANWVNQDYLAPQSFTYLLYLMVLALVLQYLRPLQTPRGQFPPGPDNLAPESRPLNRWRAIRAKALRVGAVPADVPLMATKGTTGVTVTAVVLILFTASVTAHQLTPVAMFFAVTLLAVTGHHRLSGLPLVMGVILAAWTFFAARGYIDGHLNVIAETSGVASSVQANVANRISGSSEHLQIVWLRLAMTGAIVLLAGLGALRRFRAGHADYAAAALAISPLPLFLLPYGGEVILRLYFFMLPAIAFFAATLFLPVGQVLPVKHTRHTSRPHSPARRRAFGAVLLALIMSVVMTASMVARYGNERMDFYTPQETAAVEELYRLAPPGSVLMAEVDYLPWRYRDYEWNNHDVSRGHRYLSLVGAWKENPMKSPADMATWTSETLSSSASEGRPAGFLILTRSQRAHEEILGGLDDQRLKEYLDALASSNQFRVVFENQDATIYERITNK